MSGLAVRNLKTEELRSSFQEFAETQDKAAACQKILEFLNELSGMNAWPIKSGRS